MVAYVAKGVLQLEAATGLLKYLGLVRVGAHDEL